ncbi:MAG TPA: ABC transporter substrate-binding protein [Nocardioides sp.]|jgi:peptide/nickel transport system substrate-binding protein|uniref:ABC transporter substrate-binding protein n=1 Tax=Nocardioides sp. TaxID=35761 RepID=UPI002E37F559|nr:ABC transporter substrate-binding protein [Nocardioides sp.]HEX3931705.1 ABC transporter substrate-binding protein [Nocardioides sp.]
MTGSGEKRWQVSEGDGSLWHPSRRGLVMGAGGIVAAGSLAACGSGSAPAPPGGSTGAGGAPKKGGDFRLGVTGGGSKDMMDGQNIVTKPDQARLVSAFETLLEFDDNYQLQSTGLAESVEADNPKQYTIKLRSGITFQDGKPLTADDVIYSLQRIGTQANGLTGFAATATMDIKNVKKVDNLTVQLPLLTADSTVPQTLASYTFGIVPKGYSAYKGDPSTQIGTGAYKLKSFTPGQQSVSERYAGYWRDAYFDSVTITDFSDSTAQINALKGGQIDAMTDLPANQVQAVKSSGVEALISQTGGWIPICMAIDIAPFNDPKVRQAMRLIIDRQQILDQIGSGYGQVANDLYAPFDEGYDKSLPQRTQDIGQAKSLLKSAGKEGLNVDLHTTNGASGMVELASVFASQAKAAGVTINVKNDPNYYGDSYLKLAFSVDFWGTRGYLNQVQQGSLPNSPYNETHWPPSSGEGSNFQDLYKQALAETDASKRTEIEQEMQKAEYDVGGYIIPYFNSLIDGHSSKVAGLKPSKGTLNLAGFGHGFRTIWFA